MTLYVKLDDALRCAYQVMHRAELEAAAIRGVVVPASALLIVLSRFAEEEPVLMPHERDAYLEVRAALPQAASGA